MKTVYEFHGGRYDKMRMPLEAVKAIGSGVFSRDWTNERATGAWCPREELDNQPLVDGYAGPMWDGMRKDSMYEEPYAVIRYESHRVYEELSR